MKTLLITGRLAEPRVREISSRHGCRVFRANTDVASLIKPGILAKTLKTQTDLLEGMNLILLPGLILGDIGIVEKVTGVKTYRGPKDVADLDDVLSHLGEIKLSKTVPADRLITDKLKNRAIKELEEVMASNYVAAKIKNPGNFRIGGLPVGLDFPARVVAEIVGADELSDEEVLKWATYYLKEGADIVDIGLNALNPSRTRDLVSLLKKLKAPISVDTMEKKNIDAALEAGVDLVLSFNRELLMEFHDIKTPSVVIPEKGGHIPRDPGKRVRLLEENVALALDRGFSRVIPDPLLQPLPLGFVESLGAYREFSRRQRRGKVLPMLMGVGNITELLDADSPGINAVLAGAAMEVGAVLLFTTEAGDKTRGCVAELARAVKMMYLSYRRGCLPKDMGIDLLLLKEKKIKRDTMDAGVKVREVMAKPGIKGMQMDKKGYFRIFVDDKIRCVHYYKNKPQLSVVGDKADEICDTIYGLGLVEEISHALYMGRELARAEEALVRRRSYRQG
jgi:dihydropteroate synthase-like protein